jgi:hypothetical protein
LLSGLDFRKSQPTLKLYQTRTKLELDMKNCKFIGEADEVTDEKLGTMAIEKFNSQNENTTPVQPSAPELYKVDGEEFVVLHNVQGLLTVYLVVDGELNTVDEFPPALIEIFDNEA